MDFGQGKGCRLALLLVLCASLFGSGCTFFGKETPADPAPPGQLPSGTSIVGTWSTSFADTSTSDVPTTATTETFVFDGTGSAHFEVRGQLSGQGICSGDGPYRVDNSNNIVIFIQAGTCSLPSEITLEAPSVNPTFLSYTDPTTNQPAILFSDHAQPQAPVGVWSFGGGTSGIDYLFLDQHGYFLMQTTDGSEQFLLQGYYGIANGELILTFFNGDPTQIDGELVFSSFATNGQQLVLTETTSQGDVTITGTLE